MDFLNELHAIDIPEEIILKIHAHFKGSPVYVKKQDGAARMTRNAQIFSEFNGKNSLQLCQKYQLSYPHICKIINTQRKLRQRDLFSM